MKKRSLTERIKYCFDRLISNGPIAMTALLFSVTLTLVCIVGLLAFLFSKEGSLGYQLWISLMHTLDPGTLAGNSVDNLPYLLMMSIATLGGLIITSILIGIITSGVESKLSELRKGISNVQEDNHTVIIGFNENIFGLLGELLEANANQKKACIVVLGLDEKEAMEEAIAARITDTGSTHIICRSGSYFEAFALERCSVETARSVIINLNNDAETIKTLLSLQNYLKDKQILCEELRFVAAIQNSENIEVATIAGAGRAEILYVNDTLSRIIAHTCRQHGLSQVMTEVLNFADNELYFETIPELKGKTVRQAGLLLDNAMLAGIYRDGRALLNPPCDMVILPEDELLVLEEDDGSYTISDTGFVQEDAIYEGEWEQRRENDNLLVLGSNEKLPLLLKEYSYYAAEGTRITVVDEDMPAHYLPENESLEITHLKEPVSRKLLDELIRQGFKNVLLLNDDSLDGESSDANTLLYLILLRDISEKTGCHFSITTEMRKVENQKLATSAKVDDFVIGSNFISQLMAQISENYSIRPFLKELLSEEGSEFYLKPATRYVLPGRPVNRYTLTESAYRRGETFIGYRLRSKGNGEVILNPDKDENIVFTEKDYIAVIAEE